MRRASIDDHFVPFLYLSSWWLVLCIIIDDGDLIVGAAPSLCILALWKACEFFRYVFAHRYPYGWEKFSKERPFKIAMIFSKPKKFSARFHAATPYPYSADRVRIDRANLISHLREFFRNSKLRRVALRKHAFTLDSSTRPFFYRCKACDFMFRESQVEIDHIKGIREGNPPLRLLLARLLDEKNLQVLCKTCHAKKTKLNH